MNQAAVAALFSRRGQVISWQRAHPPTILDPSTYGPPLAAAGPRPNLGPFGESYDPAVLINAYVSNRISTVAWMMFGPMDVGDAAVGLSVPFTVQSQLGVYELDDPHLNAYNTGQFIVLNQNTPIARDLFIIQNQRYVVKALPVPIVDRNTVIAWRLLVGKAEAI